MTEKPTDTALLDAPAEDASATDPALTSNKTFWTGVGIGSAALVAALIYAKRPKKKK